MTFKAFLRVSRPPTLAATVVPMLVGGALAWRTLHFLDWWAWLDIICIGFLMQIGANMLNEYFDYVKGLDTHESLGIGGIIVSGEVKPRTVWRWAVGLYVLALILGLLLVIFRDPWLLLMGILAIVAGFLYAGGPFPISATPFGEFFVFMIMGPLEITATELAAGGGITPMAWIASIPVGFLVAGILLGNNLRDRVKDGEHGRRTIPVVLGHHRGFAIITGVVAAAYAAVLVAVLTRHLPWPALLVFVSLPLAFSTLKLLSREEGLKRAVPLMGRLHVVTGILLAIGLVL
ncbi:1,4-dihydroxy-2-naphthoate octaprenyltransferase [Sulfobacillus harzensis]|uniref:1,4-dihydroxy-2-naphthoate octaprenyltransferase n=1 Tax=Sulfobacillus harzensis TaxID=2729629 RepID=A0A7Y0Q2P3_9FIRM|nr:1,4-dihydroxy-2-naphthoate octaprenyltransferase [Sulfobacillus harzensis]NMP23388.1 1,4-dihydroxy-2-naphthoate octaprenyltransferase [Sulfobacillus harzensis]